jgi:hypothetical protein
MEVNQGAQARPADERAAARRIENMRGASLGAAVMLVIQFGLGIGVNLYVTLPTAGSGGRGIGQSFSNGALLAAHTVLGLLLIVTAVSLLVRAIIARHRPVMVTATIGLLAILAAAGFGGSFVNRSTTGASMGMAMATGVALLCYIAALFILGRAPRRGPA